MKKLLALRRMLLLLAAMGLLAAQANAQVPALDSIKNQEELDKAVASLDAALFDAYNRCDLEKFSSFFVDDVEFYHDQGGVTLGRQNLTDSVKKNICGKVTRELVPGTLQVYFMKAMARWRWAFTASIIRGMRTPSPWGKGNSFIYGCTKTAHGKLRG